MVTYRLATSDDYENINSFHNHIYNSNRTFDQFLWEFHNCPFGKSIYVIAVDGERIVGLNCVIPINLITAANETILTGKSEDTLVDPEYRGQKIFQKIYDFLFEKCEEANIQLIWGFTSAKKPFKRLGFEIPYDHQQGVAVNRISQSYRYLVGLNSKNKFYDKVKILGLCIMSKVKSLGKLKPGKLKFRIEKQDKIVSGVDDLISKNLEELNSSFAIHQTSDFQEWRIYDNPNFFKTHTYGVYQDKKLLAIIVFNSNTDNVAYICQSTFSPDLSATEKVNILRSTTGMLYNEGIALVRTWLFNTNSINIEELSVFKKAGYVHLNRGIGFVWKELDTLDIKPEDFVLSRIATQGVI